MENLRTVANRAQAVLDAGRLLQRAGLEDRSAVTRRLVILEERAAIYASSADSVTRRHFTAADDRAPATGGDLASAISVAALDIYVSGVVLGGAALREGSPDQLGPSLARLSAAVADAQGTPGGVRLFASNDTFGATSVIEATGLFQKAVDELLIWLVKESAKTVAAQITLNVFILSPNLVFGVVKIQLHTKMEIRASAEAHNSRPHILMQGFLHVNRRNDLT